MVHEALYDPALANLSQFLYPSLPCSLYSFCTCFVTVPSPFFFF